MDTYQNQFYNALLGYAVQKDISQKQLCDASSINFASLQNNSCSLTAGQINSLWRNAAHFTHDPCFGLHFGESMQLAALGLIGQIIATCNTVGDALSQAARMIHMVTDMFQMEIEPYEATFGIKLVPNKGKSSTYPYTFRHLADYLLVFVLHELDGLVLKKLKPEVVSIGYDAKDIREYERIFRCTINNKGNQLSIALPLHYLSLPISTANYDLQRLLLEQAGFLSDSSLMKPAFQTKIYNYLMANSYLCTHSLGAVAANFNMSSRSLQRRLKEEGVTFLEIVEKVRKKLAIHYLKSEHYQIKDIAYTLGYNEPSAFLKAFKRWTGKTPNTYRVQKSIE